MNNYNPLVVIAVAVLVVLALAGGGLHAVLDVVLFVAWVFGFIRGWQAHWALGLLAFFVAPIGMLLGVLSIAAQRNVGHDVVEMFRRAR